MPLKTKPTVNYALIEVQRDYDGVARTDENESMQFGKLIDFHVEEYHLTASAAIHFSSEYVIRKQTELKDLIGKTVRWEQYAEGGQTFEEDGKTYALVTWWRLISVTED